LEQAPHCESTDERQVSGVAQESTGAQAAQTEAAPDEVR
jgi:hypothetical protein